MALESSAPIRPEDRGPLLARIRRLQELIITRRGSLDAAELDEVVDEVHGASK